MATRIVELKQPVSTTAVVETDKDLDEILEKLSKGEISLNEANQLL